MSFIHFIFARKRFIGWSHLFCALVLKCAGANSYIWKLNSFNLNESSLEWPVAAGITRMEGVPFAASGGLAVGTNIVRKNIITEVHAASLTHIVTARVLIHQQWRCTLEVTVSGRNKDERGELPEHAESWGVSLKGSTLPTGSLRPLRGLCDSDE